MKPQIKLFDVCHICSIQFQVLYAGGAGLIGALFHPVDDTADNAGIAAQYAG